jgi:hypothetical protein
MSLETAMKALETPAPAPQSQTLTKQEVTSAISEAESKTSNGAQLTADGKPSESKSTEAEPKKTPAEEPGAASKAFSALAKKEKAIVQRDQAAKAREAAIAEREAKIAEREARIQKSEELWDKDIFKALEERGYTYQKLTDLMLEGKTVSPESQDPVTIAKKTIEQFKEEQRKEKEQREVADKKAREEAAAKQKEEEAAAWEIYNAEIAEHVKGNPEQYELIAMYDQQKLVSETVDAFYQKNKRVLSIKEACDMVESYLEDEAKKAMQAKKFSKQTETKTKNEGEPVISKQTKTLTNDMQPTSASVLPAKSEQDRIKRALAALDGKKA